MGSDEERLEEMLRAVMDEESEKAVIRNPAEENVLPDIEEASGDDIETAIPEIPSDDIETAIPEIPSDDIETAIPEIPSDDIETAIPEIPSDDIETAIPEIPSDDIETAIPEIPSDDIETAIPEIPSDDIETAIPEMPSDDIETAIPEMPADDFAKPQPEEPKETPANDMAVDPLELLGMSEQEIDKVLEEEAALGEMFSRKSNKAQISAQPEGQDALSDIQELLQMSDDHVLVDEGDSGSDMRFRDTESDREEMQDLLGAVSDMGEESENDLDTGSVKQKEKPKKERKSKKEKRKEAGGEKKENLGKKVAAMFFGSDDDELEENAKETEKEKKKEKSKGAGNDEDLKGKKKKKEKKNKPPKKEKEKDPAKEAKKKQQREKKAEKARKKAEKAEIARKEKRAAKKLPKKRVAVWLLFCASIGAGILLINSVGMNAIQLTEARNAFSDKDYGTAYKLMNGRELSDEDQLIFKQSSSVLHLKHAEEAFDNHLKLGKPVKALEDLLKGVGKYQELLQAGENEVITPELTAEYQSILDILQEQYALSEEGALEINAIKSDYEYSLQLEALVNGETYQSQSEIVQQEEEAVSAYPELNDLLPEEEEYLNGSGD